MMSPHLSCVPHPLLSLCKLLQLSYSFPNGSDREDEHSTMSILTGRHILKVIRHMKGMYPMAGEDAILRVSKHVTDNQKVITYEF
ncbi:hypothetical protein M5D96_008827 [Drosophila gunungcola]|uniref:Uncharacterized protein n=1 Tax=Drosophila gunungcola TaxID=103775 RepID=A0A9P9YLW9_9MUSC|nr:hypothetical protein M5D96_008827 [Drosophila gunungcola]